MYSARPRAPMIPSWIGVDCRACGMLAARHSMLGEKDRRNLAIIDRVDAVF